MATLMLMPNDQFVVLGLQDTDPESIRLLNEAMNKFLNDSKHIRTFITTLPVDMVIDARCVPAEVIPLK